MFSHAVKIFTLNGFDIKVDPSWALIAALITWSLSTQYFPVTLPGQTSQTYMLMALTAMLCFFASLLLHELAHSVVARSLGLPVSTITLFLFGGVAELETEPKRPNVEFWVAIAGPIMSLCLALGFWVLALSVRATTDMDAVHSVLSYLATINLILALFNLIPAFPLDGGRVLRAYLWQRSGDSLQATKTAAQSGAILAYLLMGFGVLMLFEGALAAGLWQILIGSFVLMIAKSSYQSQLALTVFADKTAGDLMKRNPVCVGPEMTLADFADRVMLHQGLSFAPVVEDDTLLGHMDQALLMEIDRENWASTRVGDVFVSRSPETTITADRSIKAILKDIAQTGRRKYLVVGPSQNLVGVLSLADLTRHLHLTELLHISHTDRVA